MPDAKDAVCGMTVNTSEAFSAQHDGKTYWFCSEADRQAFMQNPNEYAQNVA